MDVEVLVYTAKATVAASLILSALWKLARRAEFRLALRSALPFLPRALASVAVSLIPAIEIAAAVALIAVEGRWSQLASVPAFLLVVGFSAIAPRTARSGAGCGCWPSVTRTVRPGAMLVRNLVLLLAVVSGLTHGTSLPLTHAIFGGFCGLLLAMMVMEIPTIAAFARTPASSPVRQQ